MIFAAAPSQNEVLASLSMYRELPWEKVNAFHMDEYIGLSADAPQGFGNFLKNAIFSKVPFGKVCCLDSTNDPEKECKTVCGTAEGVSCGYCLHGYWRKWTYCLQ